MNERDDPLLHAALTHLLAPSGDGSARGEGQPLEESVRRRLEGLLGRSLADVRIHDSDLAADIARRLGADAVTIGGHILGGADQLNPGSGSGFALIAHEAAHAAQQLAPAPVLGSRSDEPARPMFGESGSVSFPPAPHLALAPSGRSGQDGGDPDETAARRVEAVASADRQPRRPTPSLGPDVVAGQVYRMMRDELRLVHERGR